MTVTFKLKLEKPCQLCTCALGRKGYGQRKYHGKEEYAHRVAYVEHHDLTMADIEGVIIRHKCDNPPCIEPTHLVAGTNLDNMRDKVQRGRQSRGEHHGRAKLTADQVRAIKHRLAEGQSTYRLAAEFGVRQSSIFGIKAGKCWSHI